jgi:hypothetical protein
MGVITYNSKKLIPAPFSNIQKNIQEQPGGKLSTSFTITLTGKCVPYKGSPSADGTFWTGAGYPPDDVLTSDAMLGAIERKMEAIRQLFSTDGLELVIQSDSAVSPYSQKMYCYPRLVSIDFPAELWFNWFDYTITLEADQLYGLSSLADESFSNYISSANESWDIQEDDFPHTFKLSHSLSAVGKRVYVSGVINTSAYQYAQNYVRSRTGYDGAMVTQSSAVSGIVAGVFNISNLNNYNYTIVENKDKLTGSYGLTESWILATGNAIDNYQVKLDYLNEGNKFVRVVTIDGSVRGLYVNQNDYESGFNNAKTYFNNTITPNIIARANSYTSGVNYIQGTVNYDPPRASLNYSYTFNDRPYISGTFEEYTVTSRYNPEDYKTTVTIDGKIAGLLSLGETDRTLKYPRAQSWWLLNAKPQLYNRALIYSSGLHGPGFIVNLQSNPISKDVVQDPIDGSIQYSFSYNNRAVDKSIETFTISRRFNRAEGNTVVLAGSIQGLDHLGSGNITDRYNNALLAFPDDATAYARVTTYVTGVYLNSTPFAREVTRAPNDGTLSYNYEYNGLINPIFPGAQSELIQVTDVNPGAVNPEIPVIGRQQGPVQQGNLVNTFTARKRVINIDLVMPIYSGVASYGNAYANKPDTSTILNELKPTGIQTYKTNDQENYDIYYRRLNRTVEYTWEP